MDVFEWDDIFDDDFDLMEIIDFGFPRRLIYNRTDDFYDLDELSFFRRYRLMKETVMNLLTLIEENLEYPSNINQSVSPMNQLLTCLRFFASGSFLITVGDIAKMHASTVSRIIVRVSEAIARLSHQYIKMPSENEIAQTQRDFYQVAAFPRVIGAIDGTHVIMESPGGNDGEIFRNRKDKFSINVQAICNSNLKILDIVARWPGSAHDSTIFNNSNVKGRFEGGEFPNCLLLGDSGYQSRAYFCTPLRNPQTPAEIRYNEAHIRTRNCIERLFGIWKRRFPILAIGMRVKLQTRLTIIVATAVLHNIALEMHEEQPPPPEDINLVELEHLIEEGQIPLPIDNEENMVINAREELINAYFAHLP